MTRAADPDPFARFQVSTRAEYDVLIERTRQVEREGYSSEHDDAHSRCELALAALSYVQAASCAQRDIADSLPPPSYWPWAEECWKPRDPRRNLVRAAALILAEIERVDRMEAHLSAHPLPPSTEERGS